MSDVTDRLAKRANLRTLAKDVLSRYDYDAGEVDIQVSPGWLSNTCVATVETPKSTTTLTISGGIGRCGISWELCRGAHGSSGDELTNPNRTLFAVSATLKGDVDINRGVEGYCFDDVTTLVSSINSAATVAWENGYGIKLYKE